MITFGEAVAYVMSGMYGSVSEIGFFNCIIIISQLVSAGFIVLLLDELLQNGYGLGSGISLFIATNVCENILWRAFSPITVKTGDNVEFEGAVIGLFHSLATRSNPMSALIHSFTRATSPNLTNLLATFLVALIVSYFQGWRVEIPLVHRKQRGIQTSYAVKLFYTSNIPIILQTALVSNLYFFSQILYKKFKGNVFINILGKWKENDYGQSVPVGGIAYYISPPRELIDILTDPLHVFIYCFFILACCGLFARFWLEISGQSPKDVANQIIGQDLTVQGYRD